MTIKELKDFVYENYYRRIWLDEENFIRKKKYLL